MDEWQYADGLIVGSAIVRLIGAASSPGEAVNSVSTFVRSLRDAIDG